MVMSLQENENAVDLRPIDFHNMIVRLAQDVRLGHIAEGMAFDYDVPEDCRIMGHEPLLANALLNLIYNASKHSQGSRISIRWLRLEDGRHYFSFCDDGVGVSEEHIDRLFDLFYRVDSGRSRNNGGSGLGLPLVRRIITAMGGDITVRNSPTGGLCFTFSLPAALPQQD